jgi:small-conductance mechanosensitive channel
MKFNFGEATSAVQKMINDFIQRLPYLALAIIVFVIFIFIAKGFRSLVRRLSERNRRHYSLGVVLGRIAHGAIILVGLLIALVIAIPGFTPGQLVSILGLSSVAIGFAFRDILQNFFAGILLLLSEPFRIGDQIIVNGFEGTVEDIQTRATYLMTYDGRRVVIPNSNLFTNSVTVNTAHEKRRLQYDVGIGYGDDVARARALMIEAAREVEGTLEEPPPEALVVDLAGSSVNLRLRWWISPPRRSDVVFTTDRVLEAVRNKLTAHGIDLPFPTQQILFHDQTEETDGDRARQREGWPAGNNGAPKPARVLAQTGPARAEEANPSKM